MLKDLTAAALLGIACCNTAATAIAGDANAQTVISGQIVIIDGDTVALGRERIRLEGPDTPESYRSRCDAELIVALKAKERLRQLLDAGPFTIVRSGRLDRYQRTLATIIDNNGNDVGDTLVSEGLAVEWKPGRAAWHARAVHWCPGFTEPGQ